MNESNSRNNSGFGGGSPITSRERGLSGGSRPMLARVADATYWMSRYIERAEHVSRILAETTSILTDMGDLAPSLRKAYWRDVLRVMGMDNDETVEQLMVHDDQTIADQVCHYVTFEQNNPGSLIHSVTFARENARSVRENISGEMWENLNTLYWSLRGDDARKRFEESNQEFYRQVLLGTMLFQGLSDQTLAHGQGWLFMQIGKSLERLDLTCRTIAARVSLLQHPQMQTEADGRNIHWVSLLRNCGSLEAYRRIHVGDMDPLSVVAFLLLERRFPQSVRYCVFHAHDAAVRVRAEIDPHTIDSAVRVLGRLNTQLEYAEPQEIERFGLLEYLQSIRATGAEAADALRQAYFLH